MEFGCDSKSIFNNNDDSRKALKRFDNVYEQLIFDDLRMSFHRLARKE